MKTASILPTFTLDDISRFLNPEKLAVAGVSRNPKKFGNIIMKELSEKGFDVYPVNPEADSVRGHKCYRSVKDLPDDVKHLLIVTPRQQTYAVACNAVEKGIKMVWIQQQSDTPEAVDLLSSKGISVITGKCILMFANPVKGVHRLHRFFVKLVGKYPVPA